MRRIIGYSTGAIALSDFRKALRQLEGHDTDAIELSALRITELGPLIEALPDLDLEKYKYISLHVPSAYAIEDEVELIQLLGRVPSNWMLIVHPDAIYNHMLWHALSPRVALENMDRRKAKGRTVKELQGCFAKLPDAKFCFDIGHARQFDPSMAEAYMILKEFSDRLVQVHVSEVDAQSRHAVITYAAELAFREVSHLIPIGAPFILESRVSPSQIEQEIRKVEEVFGLA